MSASERVYSWMLLLLPRGLRARFGEAMREYFADSLRDARRRRGIRGAAAVWLRALIDVFTTAFAERLKPSGDSVIHNLMRDVRFTLRMFAKNPAFTFVAALVIALGVGAVGTIFSVANAILLRPIPGISRPGDLVSISRGTGDGEGTLSASNRYARFLDSGTTRLTGVAGWSMTELTVSTGGEGVRAFGNIVSGNYFDVLATSPALGRFFVGEERTVEDRYPVAVISHSFWQRRFSGDSAVVGSKILVNGSPFTVIGVAREGFTGIFPMLRTDMWVPLPMHRLVRAGISRLDDPRAAWLEMVGRLQPGATNESAAAELVALSKRYVEVTADEPRDWRTFTGAVVTTASGLPGNSKRAISAFMIILLAVSSLVLMIAAVNVASMLLARSVARRREIAVRVAVGAGRGRLLSQLLTESAALFAIGGIGGVGLAFVGTKRAARLELPADVPIFFDVSPDARVVTVALLVALVTGLIFGAAPALQASRLDLTTTLRGDSTGSGRARSRLRNALVVGQVAMSLLLLTGSGLFLRALDRGRRVDPGFDAQHVAVARMDVGTAGYDHPRSKGFYRDLAERVARIPGVTAVGYARNLPLSMNTSGTSIRVDGFAPRGGKVGDEFNVNMNTVDGGYFAALSIPMLQGRAFTEADGPAIVINQTLARWVWKDGLAVGRHVRIDSTEYLVTGVVPDVKNRSLDEEPSRYMYVSLFASFRPAVSLLARTTGDPQSVAALVRGEMKALDQKLPPPVTTTLDRATAVVLLPQRAAAGVTASLGLIGLLLATVGLFGVVSFSTAQRTREMGVRLALGAVPSDVTKLVMRDGMRLVAIGMAIGLVLALGATQALKPFLFGVSPIDPVTYVTIAAVLAAAAMVAAYLPARKASRLDPVTSLRQS